MNQTTLEAALPAMTAALLTEVTSSTQVVVSDEELQVARSDFYVQWTFVEDVPAPNAGGWGRMMHALLYKVMISDGISTQAQRHAWLRELRAGLHHRRLPVIAGLDHAEVLRTIVGAAEFQVGTPGSTGGIVAEAEVLFVGDVTREDVGA